MSNLLSQKYSMLASDTSRQNFINWGLDNAAVTLPQEFREHSAKNTTMPIPWQSSGGQLVSNLASKMLSALLPISTFFKFALYKATKDKISPADQIELDTTLVQLEKQILKLIETNSHRATVYLAILQLIITGNCLLVLDKKGAIRLFKLTDYVVVRSSTGMPLQIIYREEISTLGFSDDVLRLIKVEKTREGEVSQKSVWAYTSAKYDPNANKYVVTQEINDVVIGEPVQYATDRLPFIAMRCYKNDGEHYSFAYASNYIGDLNTLEAIEKSVADGFVGISKVVWGVKPGGFTKLRDVVSAKPNDFIIGDLRNDVSALELNRNSELQLGLNAIAQKEQRLKRSFMVNDQRNAERVTREEVLMNARELEMNLGGIYSVLAQEFQLPYLNAILGIIESHFSDIANLRKAGDFTIITGLASLGRGDDFQRIQTFVSSIAPLQQLTGIPELKIKNVIHMYANSLSLDPYSLLKSDEEIQQEQQALAMKEMASRINPMDLINQQQTGENNVQNNANTNAIASDPYTSY